MVHPDLFLTKSLRTYPQGRALAEIMAAALEGVDPASAMRRNLERDGDIALVADRRFNVARRVVVVGAGKAGVPVAEAAYEQLGDRITAGLVVVKEGHLGATG